ncbi:MAG TPA: chromosome partitioning protein ParA [Planctomycetes bacterium]|nr:chromosome partitioning protein ParA [Planctomycetota bacterium]
MSDTCSSCSSATAGCDPATCGQTSACASTPAGCPANHPQGISHPILVLSGKGGVGKSTVAVQLARGLARRGARVGILDADVHGPSVPRLLGLSGQRHENNGTHVMPIQSSERLAAVSIGFLMDDCDTAVIWRGPAKTGAIKQLIQQTDWGGPLDCLVVDLPPGTGDEALAAAQLIPSVAGAVVVTTPQAVATDDVRRSLAFCTKLGIKVLGIVENYAGYACPHCHQVSRPFQSGGGERLAQLTGVPLLAQLPLDPCVVQAGDMGSDPMEIAPLSPAVVGFNRMVDGVHRALPDLIPGSTPLPELPMATPALIAVPISNGQVDPHFGHCTAFALLETDGQRIVQRRDLTPPKHEPGVLPRWLISQGVRVVIAGGMGERAQQMLEQAGVVVVMGASTGTPEELAFRYISGGLASQGSACTAHEGHGCGGH